MRLWVYYKCNKKVEKNEKNLFGVVEKIFVLLTIKKNKYRKYLRKSLEILDKNTSKSDQFHLNADLGFTP